MRGLTAVGALLLLAGCGSSTDDLIGAASSANQSTEATTRSQRTSSVVTTSASPVPTVSQYASIIAGPGPAFQESMDSYADCIVRYLGTTNTPICYISLTAASYSAETMVIGLTGAANPNSPTYIGDPPAELSMLVEETLTRAGEAQQQWSEYDAANCTPNPETEVCKTERGNFVFVANMLNVTLDRWGPYL